MAIHRFSRHAGMSVLFCSLCTLFIIGCGSAQASTASSGASATATATACASFRSQTATGTIQSISGDTLSVKAKNGKTTQVTYSSSTRFTREQTLAASSLKEGTTAQVRVKQNSDSTYTATSILLTNGTTGSAFANGTGAAGTAGTGGFGRGQTSPCFSGTRGTNRGFGNAAGGNAAGGTTTTATRAITGTIGQVSSSSLSITDTQGNDYSVTLGKTTQIIQTSSVTASALQTGQNVAASGSKGSNGAITARTISILLTSSTGNAG